MLKLFTVALAFLFLIPVLSEAVTVENAPRFCNAADLAFKKHTAMNLGKDYEPAHAKANPGNAIWAILLAGYPTVACLLELPDSVSLHDSKFLIQLPFLAYEKSTESLLTP